MLSQPFPFVITVFLLKLEYRIFKYVNRSFVVGLNVILGKNCEITNVIQYDLRENTDPLHI